MSDRLKHLVDGIVLFVVFGLAVGVTGGLVLRGSADPVDPVPAYCRGVADGMRHAMEINRKAFEYAGVRLPEDPDFFQREQEADCIRLLDESLARFTYLRGPLEASE